MVSVLTVGAGPVASLIRQLQVCFVRFMGSFRRPSSVSVTRTGDLGRARRTPRWHVHPEIRVRGV